MSLYDKPDNAYNDPYGDQKYKSDIVNLVIIFFWKKAKKTGL